MSVIVTIRLKSIHYLGDNIGDDLEFVFDIDRQVVSQNNQISCGVKREFNKKIYENVISGSSINIDFKISITEKDRVFDDRGEFSVKETLSLIIGKYTKSIQGYVTGDQAGDADQQAKFIFDFEIDVESAIRQTANVWPNGWVLVRLEDGTRHPLPYGLEVELIKRENNREYFTIKEGKLRGKKASVRMKSSNESYLLSPQIRNSPVSLTYDSSSNVLSIPGLGDYSIVMDHHNPIPVGIYDLEIPYEPHSGGRYYLQDSKYAKTWFRIGHSGDRFLHPGSRSFGCITVEDADKWTEIYIYLIFSRLDHRSVGTVIVK